MDLPDAGECRPIRKEASAETAIPVLGAVGRPFRQRLLVLVIAAVAFAASVTTGPRNTLVFHYVQSIRRVPGVVVSGVMGAVCGLPVFGAMVHASSFARAALTFLPTLPAIALFLLAPETKGIEPEELDPGRT